MRTGRGYTERHSRLTLVSCAIMLFIVIGSGYYIISYGMSNRDAETEITSFEVDIALYAPDVDTTGVIRVYFSNESLFLNLTSDSEGNVAGVTNHPSGVYKLYYDGDTNDINFGPITYTVISQNKVLYEDYNFGMRIAIRTL